MIFLWKKSVRERRRGGGFTSTAPATAGIKASTDYFVFFGVFKEGKTENWGQDDFEHFLIHLARKTILCAMNGWFGWVCWAREIIQWGGQHHFETMLLFFGFYDVVKKCCTHFVFSLLDAIFKGPGSCRRRYVHILQPPINISARASWQIVIV